MSDRQPAPVYKHHLVFVDVVGHTSAKHVVFGAFLLPWERRGDFSRRVTAFVPRGAALAKPAEPDARLEALVDDVFQMRWLSFRAIVCPVGPPAEMLRLAALDQLLRPLIERRRSDDPSTTWKLRVAEHVRGLTEALGREVESIELRIARYPLGLDLAHLFTTAVAWGWDKSEGSAAVHQVGERIAKNLGWSDLAAVTPPEEWKVNVAYVDDPTRSLEPKSMPRSVQLRLPLLD
ncbi:MAG: hypothetical protein HY791_11465 [Deltaproteobacteria bacterium]|nr:hypothetical protein [Deltaproteobacteria bacterium]